MDTKTLAAHIAFFGLLIGMLVLVGMVGRDNLTGSAVYDPQGAKSAITGAFAGPLAQFGGTICFLIKADADIHEISVIKSAGSGTSTVQDGCPSSYDFLLEFKDYDALTQVLSNPTMDTFLASKDGVDFEIGVSDRVQAGGNVVCDEDFKQKFCPAFKQRVVGDKFLIDADLTCCVDTATPAIQQLIATHEAETGFVSEVKPIVEQAPVVQQPAANYFNYIIFGIVGIALISLIIGLVMYSGHQKEEQLRKEMQAQEAERRAAREHELELAIQKTKEYIADMRQQGYEDGQIKESLHNQGWQDSDLEHLFAQ